MAIATDKSVESVPVSTVSRRKGWADLDLSLKKHPIQKDIIPLKDDKAIRNAVKNLVLTNFYERPFQHSKGANLQGLLFEPADMITAYEIKESIKVLQMAETQLKMHEDTLKLLSISRNSLINQLREKLKHLE